MAGKFGIFMEASTGKMVQRLFILVEEINIGLTEGKFYVKITKD
jgi:hypothetical protein